MSDSALFGRYWSADSPLHALDPRTKIVGLFAFMVIVFCAQTFAALAVCAVACFAFFALGRIPAGQALRSIAPLLFIVVITALLNLFFVQGGTVLAAVGPLFISREGVYAAAFLGCRLLLLLLASSLMTLTTTTLDTTDAIERLMKPLARVGFPAHECAMIAGIALRFVPQFAEEADIMRKAQMARGAALSGHGWLATLSSMMVPLFSSAFRHAETLAAAMDARCYHGAGNRTRLKMLRFTRRDYIAAAVLLAVAACVIAANVVL